MKTMRIRRSWILYMHSASTLNLLTAVLRASEFVNDTSLKAELVEISIEAQSIYRRRPGSSRG